MAVFKWLFIRRLQLQDRKIYIHIHWYVPTIDLEAAGRGVFNRAGARERSSKFPMLETKYPSKILTRDIP